MPERKRLMLDPKEPFPEKVYDVVNDGALLRWNDNGSVSTDEEKFEKYVMSWYPGFVQIPSFVNLRRLFREYGFQWRVNDDEEIEFYHSSFVHGKRELLGDIRTRRKSFSVRRVDSDEECGRRYRSRKRKRTENEEIEPNAKRSRTENSDEQGEKMHREKLKPNTKEIMEMFAQNEFTEEEYLKWLEKQELSKKDKHESLYFTAPLVYNYPDSFVYTSEECEEIPIGAPCGMCQCCVAHTKLRLSEMSQEMSRLTSTPLSVKKNSSNVIDYEFYYEDSF